MSARGAVPVAQSPLDGHQRHRHAGLGGDGRVLRLAHRTPLDWQRMLGYFAARSIAGVEAVSDGTYRRTVSIDGTPGMIELSRGGTDRLLLRAHLPHGARLTDHVQRARRIFNLDADIEVATAHLSGDPVIGPLIVARPGLRAPGTWDPFETGVRAIIGQQVSVAGANTLSARLVERLGEPIPGLESFGLTHLFPPPEALAVADLAGVGLTAARSRAINAFARAVLEGEVWLDRSQSLEQLVQAITAVPGLGPWTAEYVALRAGSSDAFPATDLGLRRAAISIIGHTVSGRELEAMAESWRPFRALTATHLWLAG